MFRAWAGVAAGVVLMLGGGFGSAQAEPAPVEVMVLSTYHLANPGRDLVNMKADDVLAPRRQRELERLAASLARFRPTKVAVEAESEVADLTLPAYRAWTPEKLKTQRNEIGQIGYRLAARMGHWEVYGIDEQGGEGEPDYFPFGEVVAYAKGSGEAAMLTALQAKVAAEVKALEAAQATSTLPQLLMRVNGRDYDLRGQRDGYYRLLAIGDAKRQPGAELNAYWYMRNAKIMSKLAEAARPGDRIVVVYGAGHGYWLRHLVETTPGFRLVDPLPYLSAAR